MSNKKPHKGLIENWSQRYVGQSDHEDKGHLGYYIVGMCVDHPNFGTSPWFHTSMVVARKGNEIETYNSRYTLGTSRAQRVDVV